LKVIPGARVSWYDFTEKSGIQTMDENAVFSPYLGLMRNLTEGIAIPTRRNSQGQSPVETSNMHQYHFDILH
jgi:hypothetical protein